MAIVTRAKKGIGFAMVKRLAQLGLTVILTAKDIEKGHKTKKKINCLDARTHVSYIMLNIYIENNIMLNMMLHKCHTFI